MNHKIFPLVAICLLAILATGCADPNHLSQSGAPGFWTGLWDGMTAVIAFIGHLFGADWGVYEVVNNGGWYDFGFLLGIGAFSAGGASTVHAR